MIPLTKGYRSPCPPPYELVDEGYLSNPDTNSRGTDCIRYANSRVNKLRLIHDIGIFNNHNNGSSFDAVMKTISNLEKGELLYFSLGCCHKWVLQALGDKNYEIKQSFKNLYSRENVKDLQRFPLPVGAYIGKLDYSRVSEYISDLFELTNVILAQVLSSPLTAIEDQTNSDTLYGTVGQGVFVKEGAVNQEESEAIWTMLQKEKVLNERGEINTPLTINQETINTWLAGKPEAARLHALGILQQVLDKNCYIQNLCYKLFYSRRLACLKDLKSINFNCDPNDSQSYHSYLKRNHLTRSGKEAVAENQSENVCILKIYINIPVSEPFSQISVPLHPFTGMGPQSPQYGDTQTQP